MIRRDVKTEQTERVDRALRRLLPELSARQARDCFKARDVRLNGVRVPPDAVASAGDTLTVFYQETPVPALDIRLEDDNYVIINKAQGMPVQGEGSLEQLLARQLGAPVYACHRLDVMTGGLVLLARNGQALSVAEEAFAAHTVKKTYRALVRGCPEPREATLTAYLIKDAGAAKVRVLDRPAPGARTIQTAYRVIDPNPEISRVEVQLLTGRTHQIRAHMAHIGHPILGDDKYGDRALNRAHGAKRQVLWSTRLMLWDGREVEVKEGF